MSFLFECPQCGAHKVITDAAVGRRVRCPACEALVEITLPADIEEEPVDLEGVQSTTQRVFSGVAISAPSLQPDWGSESSTPGHIPGVPVLAIADDEDADEAVQVRSKPEEAEMDMTPMVDVTFQLLIFFHGHGFVHYA